MRRGRCLSLRGAKGGSGRRISLPERVAARLRQAILARELKPGDHIVEERLAADFAVSRNPVREALRALAADGLIEISARRGAFVASVTEEEAREMIEVRALLEGHNARLVARHKDARTLKRIEAILERGLAAAATERFDQLPALNEQFHRELAEAGQNRLLGELLTRLRERTAMLFSPGEPERQAPLWNEHAGILRAILDGDEDEAAARAARHVMHARVGFPAAPGTAREGKGPNGRAERALEDAR